MKSRETIVVILLLMLFGFLSGSGAFFDSLTYDEPAHYRYGEQFLSLDATRFDDSKMPVTALNVLPVKVLKAAFPSLLAGRWQVERIGRISTLIVGLFLGFLIYRWAKDLYGKLAGMISLLLFALEPNLIAHSHLITTDIYATFMAVLSIYCFWRFTNNFSLRLGLLSAFILGVAQITKYTSIFLYPILLLIVIVRFGPSLFQKLRFRQWKELRRSIGRFVLYCALFVAISLAVINAGFLFDRTLTPIQAYPFRSDVFVNIQARLGSIADLRIPLPYPYVEGLDLIRFRERTGHGFGNIYLLGNIRQNGSFAGYFFVVSLLKMPIFTQLLILSALIICMRKFQLKEFIKQEWYLAAPIILFAIYYNFFYKVQIGIRYYLVIFPFLLVFAGSIFRDHRIEDLKRPLLLYAGIAYLFLSVLSFYPTYIPYVNEIILDRKQIYRFLGDSNVDWGQAEGYLAAYLERNPDAIVDPGQRTEGKVIVGINRLVGVRGGLETYRWLNCNYHPLGHIAYSYLIFEIPATGLYSGLDDPYR